MITVYGKEDCVQCKFTQKLLSQLKVSFRYVDIGNDKTTATQLKNEGWLSLPVVKTATSSWSGFRPEKIKGYMYEI